MLFLRLVVVGFIGYFITVTIMPSGDPVGDIEKLGTLMFIDAPVGILYYFGGLGDSMKAMDTDAYNPLQNWVWLVGWIGTVALSLALPFFWVISMFVTIWLLLSTISPTLGTIFAVLLTGSDGRPESAASKVNGHLLTGRITIDESIKNDAAAQAIVAALDERNKGR